MAERNLPLFIVDESHSKDNNSCCTSEFGSINLYYGSLLFFFALYITTLYLFVGFSLLFFLVIDVFMAYRLHVSTVFGYMLRYMSYIIITILRTQKK